MKAFFTPGFAVLGRMGVGATMALISALYVVPIVAPLKGGKVEHKSTYCELVDDLVVGCGIYREGDAGDAAPVRAARRTKRTPQTLIAESRT